MAETSGHGRFRGQLLEDREDEQGNLWQYGERKTVERTPFENYVRGDADLQIYIRVLKVVEKDVPGRDWVLIFERADPVLDPNIGVAAADNIGDGFDIPGSDERRDVFVRVACVVQTPEGMAMSLALIPSFVRLVALDELPCDSVHSPSLVAAAAARVPTSALGVLEEEMLFAVMDREPRPTRWSLGLTGLCGEMVGQQVECGAEVVKNLADQYGKSGRRLIFDFEDRSPLDRVGAIAPACLLVDGMTWPALEVVCDSGDLVQVFRGALNLRPSDN